MGDRQIWYHIREGFRSIFTHGLMSIAAVCMTVACLLIMGSFSLIAINANPVLGDLEDDNQFLAYIDDSLTRAQAQALESQIKAVPNVADIHFVTKEEALANFKANQERQDLFDNVESDTLRDRYEIHVVDIQLMQETVDQVKDIDGIAKVQASLEIADGFGHHSGGDAGAHLHLHHRQHHQAGHLHPAGGDRHYEDVRRHQLVCPVALPGGGDDPGPDRGHHRLLLPVGHLWPHRQSH